MRAKIPISGLAGLALIASAALAQEPAPGGPSPGTPPSAQPAPEGQSSVTTPQGRKVEFKTGMQMGEKLASRIRGTDVRNTAGENLGEIEDLVLSDKGAPSVAVIGVGGFLGLGEKRVGVPFDQLAFATNEDGERVARLDVTKQALDAAPSYQLREERTSSGVGSSGSTADR